MQRVQQEREAFSESARFLIWMWMHAQINLGQIKKNGLNTKSKIDVWLKKALLDISWYKVHSMQEEIQLCMSFSLVVSWHRQIDLMKITNSEFREQK